MALTLRRSETLYAFKVNFLKLTIILLDQEMKLSIRCWFCSAVPTVILHHWNQKANCVFFLSTLWHTQNMLYLVTIMWH